MALTDKLTAIADAIRAKTGSTAALTLPQMAAAIGTIQPGKEPVNDTFSQVNDVVAQFLANVTYDPSDYSVSSVESYNAVSTDYSKDKPAGYVLNGSKLLTITDSGAQKSVNTTNSVVYNLTPSTGGFFFALSGGNIDQCGRLIPTGSLRMIALPSCGNVRDLGGWTCDGGTVKYGKLFRGSKFAGSRGVTVTDADKDVLKNLLGIRADIDFQLSSEGGAREISGLGSNVEYIPCPTNTSYANMVNLGGNTLPIKTALLKVFNNVQKDLPTYFHCFYGADRTGTFACVLESLLGMSQSDIDKDYELTTFYTGASAPRTRNGTVYPYSSLISYFYTFGKSNLRDNVVIWALRLGIHLSEINAFRSAMIDGSPSALTTDTVAVTNTLTDATTDNNAVTTWKYDSYTAKITADSGYTLNGAAVSVTMSGTDITASAYHDGVISIPHAEGDIVITVSAASAARLPAEYQEVNYIENSDSAWIDTGVTSKYGIRTEVGCSITSTGGYQSVIGAYGSVRDAIGYVGLYDYWAAPNTAAAGTSTALSRNVLYETECVRTSSGYLNFGSVSAGTNAYTDYTNTVTYALFARNRGTTQDYYFKGKIYYCKIYDGDTLIADLVPCYRKSDGVVGMYDIVSNTFLTNSGTGTFSKGEDAVG